MIFLVIPTASWFKEHRLFLKASGPSLWYRTGQLSALGMKAGSQGWCLLPPPAATHPQSASCTGGEGVPTQGPHCCFGNSGRIEKASNEWRRSQSPLKWVMFLQELFCLQKQLPGRSLTSISLYQYKIQLFNHLSFIPTFGSLFFQFYIFFTNLFLMRR